MSVTVERAEVVDSVTLLAVQIRAFHHDSVLYPDVPVGGPPDYDSLDALRHKIHTADYYKILLGEQIVGGIVIFNRGGGHFHLDLLYLDPPHHNQGIGTQAMQFIEQRYSATRWTLDTPQYAIRNQHFYAKLGYRKVGEFLEEGGELVLFAYEKMG